MANSCQCTAGATGSLGAVGMLLRMAGQGSTSQGWSHILSQEQPGLHRQGFVPGHSLTLWGAFPLSNYQNQTLHGNAGAELTPEEELSTPLQ